MGLKERKKVTEDQVAETIKQLQQRIHYRIRQYGNHSFASKHEVLGLLAEEYHELVEAVRTEKGNYLPKMRDELFDIAVACLFGVTCIDQGGLDW